MSSSLWPHGLQHIRLTCPPLSPGLCYSCPLSWGCYLTISSSAARFPFCFPSFPASGSFPVSWVFTLDGQSIGASSSASVLPKNIQDWFPLGLTSLIFLLSKGLSRVFSNSTVQKHPFYGTQLSLQSNSNIYMTTRKTKALTRWTFVGKVMSLLFNMLSRLVITFLPICNLYLKDAAIIYICFHLIKLEWNI